MTFLTTGLCSFFFPRDFSSAIPGHFPKNNSPCGGLILSCR
jgi:hypothetical protein